MKYVIYLDEGNGSSIKILTTFNKYVADNFILQFGKDQELKLVEEMEVEKNELPKT